MVRSQTPQATDPEGKQTKQVNKHNQDWWVKEQLAHSTDKWASHPKDYIER